MRWIPQLRKQGDLKDPQLVGAVKALDANSVALAKTLGSVYPDAEKPFLASWRQHIGFFVDYTLGKATENDKQVAQAKADLDTYRTSSRRSTGLCRRSAALPAKSPRPVRLPNAGACHARCERGDRSSRV